MVSQKDVVMESQKSACSGLHRLFHLNFHKLFGMCHDLASKASAKHEKLCFFVLKSLPIFAISGRCVHVDIRLAINSLFLSRFGR